MKSLHLSINFKFYVFFVNYCCIWLKYFEITVLFTICAKSHAFADWNESVRVEISSNRKRKRDWESANNHWRIITALAPAKEHKFRKCSENSFSFSAEDDNSGRNILDILTTPHPLKITWQFFFTKIKNSKEKRKFKKNSLETKV